MHIFQVFSQRLRAYKWPRAIYGRKAKSTSAMAFRGMVRLCACLSAGKWCSLPPVATCINMWVHKKTAGKDCYLLVVILLLLWAVSLVLSLVRTEISTELRADLEAYLNDGGAGDPTWALKRSKDSVVELVLGRARMGSGCGTAAFPPPGMSGQQLWDIAGQGTPQCRWRRRLVHQLEEAPPPHKAPNQRWVFFMLKSPGWSRNYNYQKWRTVQLDHDIQAGLEHPSALW